MNECSSCHVDYYNNPDVRVYFSGVCDHRVCEPCITRLFIHGRVYPCPTCGTSLRAEDFSDQPKESRLVESEVKIRRQISGIYCKAEAEFSCREDWNEYLQLREDIVFKLAHPSSQEEAKETWRQIDVYREANEEQIFREQRLRPRRKFQKVTDIIAAEGCFAGLVNSDCGKGLRPDCILHPFQERYRDILEHPPEDHMQAQPVDTSPFAPQPLFGGHVAGDRTRHRSGGGQPEDAAMKKARHFFFAELVAAVHA